METLVLFRVCPADYTNKIEYYRPSGIAHETKVLCSKLCSAGRIMLLIMLLLCRTKMALESPAVPIKAYQTVEEGGRAFEALPNFTVE